MDQNLIFPNQNIFKLLKLNHLSEEEKTKRLKQMAEIVLKGFVAEDLPKLLSEEKISQLEKLMGGQSVEAVKVEEFLRSNIADFDLLIAQKTLKLKRDLVLGNLYAWENARPKDLQVKKAIVAVESGNWEEAEKEIELIGKD